MFGTAKMGLAGGHPAQAILTVPNVTGHPPWASIPD